MSQTSFTIETVSIRQIDKDSYQRDLSLPQAEKIADEFDAAQWDLPKLVLTGPGVYRVVAGQHRVVAANILEEREAWPFDTPPGNIQAQVVHGVTSVKEEARLFLRDAKNKKSLRPYDTHRAALVAEYRDALEIQDALDRWGIPLTRKQRAKSGGSLVAITKLYWLWNRAHGGNPDGAKLVSETLKLAVMWPADDVYRFDGLLLGGLGIVAQEHLNLTGKTNKIEKLVRRLPAMTIAGLAQKYSVQHAGVFSNTPEPYAAVIRERIR